MATIRPIEGSSVHRIQSGQVIVDLCSVVKELVENSLDAGATSIDVRFKNHGLDAIEVQDNGSGIAKEDYETIALKHYTSKLSSYEDLDTLDTFGFRGEALSSLCALANVHVTTAREHEAPKGMRLDFEASGKLKETSTVAAQRGTTVFVQTIFKNLPVRRQELDRNIKREYGKVLALLQAYACISTDVRLSVSNTMGKKKMVAFSTKGNKTTRDNIVNVYSAKALATLMPLDLEFEMQSGPSIHSASSDRKVKILGHVSRPVVGEGRPLPDRQMFFVNSRPCTLPQVSKVFNEVYKSYNLTQSPFVFANLSLDTNAYDVNVSPDKRSILLHDQGSLLEAIKNDLIRLFEQQQQTVPQSQRVNIKLPSYKPLTISRQVSRDDEKRPESVEGSDEEEPRQSDEPRTRSAALSLISQFAGRNTRKRDFESPSEKSGRQKEDLLRRLDRDTFAGDATTEEGIDHLAAVEDTPTVQQSYRSKEGNEDEDGRDDENSPPQNEEASVVNADAESNPSEEGGPEDAIPSVSTTPIKHKPGVVPNAFDRMRPLRTPTQTATITIGDKTTVTTIGSKLSWPRRSTSKRIKKGKLTSQITNSLRSFAAPGSQLNKSDHTSDDEEQDDDGGMSDTSTPASIKNENVDSEQTGESEDEARPDQEEEQNEDEEGLNTKDAVEVENSDEAEDSDGEYLDEETKRKREEARVAKLIQKAEKKAARPSQNNAQRAQKLLKGAHKDSTTRLTQSIGTSLASIERQLHRLNSNMNSLEKLLSDHEKPEDDSDSVEERLSLTVSKSDFSRMRIIGQFNLGFIIALRPGDTTSDLSLVDELFIIDQHASDEKFNFERLQATTTLQNQRLVHPQTLDLTAIEEEIIADNEAALLQNGFIITMNNSDDDVPVGKRCTLLSLPTSREVTFDTRDLEELLALLSENPTSSSSTLRASNIPRPSKVRRLFAMRACRSSVMIGKTLTSRHMEKLVRNMGEIDKPWNCPHGRPTMRHLLGLGKWEGWREGMGVVGLEEEEGRGEVDWEGWLGLRGGSEGDDEEVEGGNAVGEGRGAWGDEEDEEEEEEEEEEEGGEERNEDVDRDGDEDM